MAHFVQVSMPFIIAVSIGRRMYRKMEETENPLMCSVGYSFMPPESTSEWPKTIEDIGNSEVERLLKWVKNGAVGSNLLFMRP